MSAKNVLFYFSALYFYEKTVEYSFDMILFYGIRIKFIMRKFIWPTARHEEKVQRFVMFLSAVVHVVQYVKLSYINLH